MTNPAPTPVAAQTVRVTDREITQLTWREIESTARFIARARAYVLPIAFGAIFALLLLEPDPWRLWLFGGTVVVAGAIMIRDFFWFRTHKLKPAGILYVLSVVIAFQSMLIAVTGGVESPFFVILAVMGVVPALSIGRPRPFIGFALIPVSIIWFFTLGAVTGLLPRLTPDFWGPGATFGTNAVYAYTRAGVFTTAVVLGGTIGLALRAALERSVRKAAEARQELLETMRERNQELLSLSGELAHELKNPLASIQGLSGLIAKKLSPESKEAEQMGVLISEVKRMGANLDEFLNFSRPPTGLAVREIHPAELLADVALIHEGMAHGQGVTLDVDPGDAMPIRCDPRKVKQVLVNLLQNALDATPTGGRIWLSTRHGEGGTAQFVIRDTGSGLADEMRGRLFSPGATTKADGTGLGLTIARAIAEQHGGALALEPLDAGGCEARLILPLRPITNEPNEPSEPTTDPGETS